MSKHCRILALILSLTTLLCVLPALGDGLPEAFSVTYKTEDRFVNHKRGFVSKEHIAAANPAVASEINALVDAYDEQYAPALKGSDNPKRNSRLDIHVVHSVTGTKWVSFLVLARQSYARKQLSSPFTARAYDMDTGRQLVLTDVVQDTPEAWDILSAAVREQLSAYFPNEEANVDTLNPPVLPRGAAQHPLYAYACGADAALRGQRALSRPSHADARDGLLFRPGRRADR